MKTLNKILKELDERERNISERTAPFPHIYSVRNPYILDNQGKVIIDYGNKKPSRENKPMYRRKGDNVR